MRLRRAIQGIYGPVIQSREGAAPLPQNGCR